MQDDTYPSLDKVINNIGYCGLICTFCHRASECTGCSTEGNTCERRLSASGCFQYECCKEKGIRGCWECEIAPCDKDMFSPGHDLRLRAFIRFAKEHGIEKLAECVLINQKNGILYGYKKDYDNLASEEAVIAMLLKATLA